MHQARHVRDLASHVTALPAGFDPTTSRAPFLCAPQVVKQGVHRAMEAVGPNTGLAQALVGLLARWVHGAVCFSLIGGW